MKSHKKQPQFAICIRNEECEDLALRKIYQVLPDASATEEGYIRVVDESGEDYLYPNGLFCFCGINPRGTTCLIS